MTRLRAEALQRAGTKIMKEKKTSSMIHMKTVLVNGIISTIDRFLCATQLFAEDVSPLALCPVERLVGLLENLGRD